MPGPGAECPEEGLQVQEHHRGQQRGRGERGRGPADGDEDQEGLHGDVRHPEHQEAVTFVSQHLNCYISSI